MYPFGNLFNPALFGGLGTTPSPFSAGLSPVAGGSRGLPPTPGFSIPPTSFLRGGPTLQTPSIAPMPAESGPPGPAMGGGSPGSAMGGMPFGPPMGGMPFGPSMPGMPFGRGLPMMLAQGFLPHGAATLGAIPNFQPMQPASGVEPSPYQPQPVQAESPSSDMVRVSIPGAGSHSGGDVPGYSQTPTTYQWVPRSALPPEDFMAQQAAVTGRTPEELAQHYGQVISGAGTPFALARLIRDLREYGAPAEYIQGLRGR